jgi:2,3-bisphosphoglycerate-independent phosphoglycerate mutase
MQNQSLAPRQPVLLVIMDGIGLNPSPLNNAVAMAATPNLDQQFASNPVTVLEASGAAVGLPDGQMGNSEVGHLTIGCGAILRQDLVVINEAIRDGSFASNPAIANACQAAAKGNQPLHLIGLVSDGGVHSHLDHVLALIECCKQYSVVPMLHMITDGRDTAPQCATRYLEQVEPALQRAGGRIATVSGRYYAMDRDNRWERVERAWQAMVNGVGERASSAREAIEAAWQRGETDEFVSPTVIEGGDTMSTGSQAIFFNFRNDRPRELAATLVDPDFSHFERGDFATLSLVTMTHYHDSFDCPVAFTKDQPEQTLGAAICDAGVAQFHAAETEKYPHVTFFFNGGREQPFDLEDRGLSPSPKVETYDLKPEMSAYDVRDSVLDALQANRYGFIVVNLANGDMVGHTGVPEAVVRAVEVVDEVVGELLAVAETAGYSVILTADHGNADMLVDPVSGVPHTQHTTFPVACMVKDKSAWQLANGYGLSAIAPTVLQLMGIEKPSSMTGQSLLLEER